MIVRGVQTMPFGNISLKRKPKPVKVGVIGTGSGMQSFGWATAKTLSEQDWVSHIYLFNRTSEKTEHLKSELDSSMSDLEIIANSDFDDIVHNTDVALVTLDANTEYRKKFSDLSLKYNSFDEIPLEEKPSRDDVLAQNIHPIKNLAKNFRGYEGHVIVVTNPVDVLAYTFAAFSNLPTSQVTGFTHIDSKRFEKTLRKYRQQFFDYKQLPKIENAFVIGAHDKTMVPVFSQAFIDNDLVNDRQEILENKEKIDDEIKKYGSDILLKTGSTATAGSRDLVEAVKTITGHPDARKKISASTYFRDAEKEGSIFIGLPVYGDNGKIYSDTGFLDSINEEERENFKKSVEKQYELLNSLNLEKIVDQRKADSARNNPHVLSNDDEYIIEFEDHKEKPKSKSKLYISTGNQHEIISSELNFPENTKTELVTKIRGGEHYSGDVKIYDLGRKKLLFVGTSQGIISKDLDSGEKNEYLIPEAELEEGYVIRSLEFFNGRIFGSYNAGDFGKGIFEWKLSRPGNGKLIFEGDTNDSEQTLDSGFMFNQLNNLYLLDKKATKIKKITSLDNIITELSAVNDKVLVGDSNGVLSSMRYDGSQQKVAQASLFNNRITGLDSFSANNTPYAVVGDSKGQLAMFNVDTMKNVGRIPLFKSVNDEKRGPAITSIKYFPENGHKWLFLSVGNQVVKYRVHGMLNLGDMKDINLDIDRYPESEHGIQGLYVQRS